MEALTGIRLLRLLSEAHSDTELLFCGSRASCSVYCRNRLSVSIEPAVERLAQRDGEVAGDSMALGRPIASRRSDRRV